MAASPPTPLRKTAFDSPSLNRFLTHLACECNVEASTQNQARWALLFLYGAVLDQKLDWLESAIHAKRPERLPPIVILSMEGDI